MTQNGDFSKGSIIKILMRLAIPMTLAQLMNVLYNVVDRMFIGRIGGDSMDALTGVGVCLPDYDCDRICKSGGNGRCAAFFH